MPRGAASKYGRILTSAEHARLWRLRKSGVITEKTERDEVLRLVATVERPGPKPLIPGMTQADRMRIKRKLGKTPSQLRKELDDA